MSTAASLPSLSKLHDLLNLLSELRDLSNPFDSPAALKSTLELRGTLDVWNKAVLYHFIHAIALLVLALYGMINRGGWWLLFAGIFLFSGSLYLIALTNLRWLGPVTPIGGLCFLAGWAWLILAPTK